MNIFEMIIMSKVIYGCIYLVNEDFLSIYWVLEGMNGK